jgi:signal transduction histidine kinase/CheY-like chemotaxis protein
MRRKRAPAGMPLDTRCRLRRPGSRPPIARRRVGRRYRRRSPDAAGYPGASHSYLRAPVIAIYTLLGLLLVFSGLRWRLHRLQRQNEQLNRLVEERTRELAHANTTKNEFLESISHEIRNPLNGIANLVDLLRDAPLRSEERHLAQSLGRSTEHLKQVFADVLSYTKLEYGQVNLHLAPFSRNTLLQDVVALHGIEARRQETDLALELPPDFSDGFRGDAQKIRAIVSNYVGNALKYASGRPVRMEVTCEPGLSDPALVELWIGVRDHGPGIPPEEQALLFRKFARGARAKASGISGTGLGLATCRSMAELMDGRVGVTSQPGEGATFWLRLPLERASPPAAFSARVPEPTAPVEGARALIVDDQEYNQTVLRGIARRLGYEADVASHAGEVWPIIAQHRYSVVFLDWELPGLNGGEIARRLRRENTTRSAIIIATTAHDTDDIRQHCLEAGMDGFALKPFDTAKMRAILGQAHAQHAGRTPAAAATSPETAAPATEPRGLTLDAFADFAAGDPARARDAVSLYLQTLAQELDALRAAMERGDRETVARQAHRLRSHAGLVNGTALNTAAQHLVQAARDPALADARWRALCPAVFAEGEALERAVTSLRTGPTAGE